MPTPFAAGKAGQARVENRNHHRRKMGEHTGRTRSFPEVAGTEPEENGKLNRRWQNHNESREGLLWRPGNGAAVDQKFVRGKKTPFPPLRAAMKNM